MWLQLILLLPSLLALSKATLGCAGTIIVMFASAEHKHITYRIILQPYTIHLHCVLFMRMLSRKRVVSNKTPSLQQLTLLLALQCKAQECIAASARVHLLSLVPSF